MPRARRVQYEPAAARRQFEQGGWVPPVGGPGRPDRRLSTARGRFALPQDRSRAMTAGRVTVRAPAAYGHRLIDRPDSLRDGSGRHVRPTPFVERACHLMASRMTYAAGIRATPWPLGPSSWTGGMPMALGARSPRQSTGSPERPPITPLPPTLSHLSAVAAAEAARRVKAGPEHGGSSRSLTSPIASAVWITRSCSRSSKSHDGRFVQLIRCMLRAGYLEDWQWNATLSGAPQGGGCLSCPVQHLPRPAGPVR